MTRDGEGSECLQGADGIATRAAGGDFQGARSIIKTMMEDCRTCHREFKPLS